MGFPYYMGHIRRYSEIHIIIILSYVINEKQHEQQQQQTKKQYHLYNKCKIKVFSLMVLDFLTPLYKNDVLKFISPVRIDTLHAITMWWLCVLFFRWKKIKNQF